MPNTNVNIELLINTFDKLKATLNSTQSWDAKHHKIFYEDMSVRTLYEADEFLMKEYQPIVSTNKTECLHLFQHCEQKVTYMKELGK